MNKNNYTPHPIDTKDVALPKELNALAENIAKNVHEVCFYYYRLIVRFCPSCNVIDCCTTMASADFSR